MSALRGRRVLVTRRAAQAADLVAALEALGAEVVLAPAIEVVPPLDWGPLDVALKALDSYDWLALTSANAVSFMARRLRELGLASSPLPAVASVGPGTSRALRQELGRQPDLEPASDYQAQALVRLLADRGRAGSRLLFPTSDRGRETLPAALAALGWEVDSVVAYRTAATADLAAALRAAGPLDMVTFASPSAVAACVAAAPELAARVPCAVIGPVTADAARAAGFRVVRVAAPSTVPGLVGAIVAQFGPAP